MNIVTADDKGKVSFPKEFFPPNSSVDLDKCNPLFYAFTDIGHGRDVSSDERTEMFVLYLLHRDLYHQLFDFDSDLYKHLTGVKFSYQNLLGKRKRGVGDFLNEMSFDEVRVDPASGANAGNSQFSTSLGLTGSYKMMLPSCFNALTKDSRRKIMVSCPPILLPLNRGRPAMRNQLLILEAHKDDRTAMSTRIPENTYYRSGFDAIFRAILKNEYGVCDATT